MLQKYRLRVESICENSQGMISMNDLRALLMREDDVERQQRLHHGININDMGLKYGPNIIPKIPRTSFFKHSYVEVTKQHRYSYMPAHTHSFIEINYEYSGQSNHRLNGHQVVLKKNQLLIMDHELIQKYDYMGKNDLLVNILIDPTQLPTDFFTDIATGQDVGRFIYNAINARSGHTGYMVFDLNDYPERRGIWENLIYYGLIDAKPFSTRGILLKAALSALSEADKTNLAVLSDSSVISDIVSYIDQHYQTATLTNVGRHFGYNKNYLSNKLKHDTGLSFKALIDRKRLLVAETYLLDTDMATEEIAAKIGFKNSSSLFRLFNKKLELTPAEFRSQYRKLEAKD